MPRRLLLTVSDPARLAQLNSLVRSAGYEVRTAFAGQQALDLLRIENPEVLLLDYELYETDGVETIRRLRSQERGRSSIPVVLLIGTGHEAPRREALKLGVRSIVTLPYQPAELLRCVRNAGIST
jgi:two-component system alkaline phosphatase synthesis response regulator PhoP